MRDPGAVASVGEGLGLVESPADMSWIDDGLRFECTACGNCCKGPGYVWVRPLEIRRMARALGLCEEEFSRRYVSRVDARLSLTDRGSQERCVLLGDDDRCAVYDARPDQCRSFPFWREHLRKRSAWEALGKDCPGIDRGRIHTREEIQRIQALAECRRATAPGQAVRERAGEGRDGAP